MRAASSLLLVLLAGLAHAEPTAADAAFKRGRDLLKAGKYAEACTAFEESQRLDPSLGTQFNIAQCDEKTGKLASALAIYRELAAHDTNAGRKATSTELAGQLAGRVPKLEVQVEPRPPGLTVSVNGTVHACPEAPCTGSIPLDSGSYAIAARAPGFRDATATATIADEGKVVIVSLRLEPLPAAAPVSAPVAEPSRLEPPPPEAPPRSRRKPIGAVLAIAGGASLLGGAILGVVAHGRWTDAKAICGGSTACANQDDVARAQVISDDAKSKGNVATLLVVAGGLLAAGGVVLWVTAPHEDRAVQLGAAATASSVGVTLAGRF